MNTHNNNYFHKYLKYKSKYLSLHHSYRINTPLNQFGGTVIYLYINLEENGLTIYDIVDTISNPDIPTIKI